MTFHRAQYRSLYRAQNIWTVGCTCGWLSAAPVRGTKATARDAWRAHRAEEETTQLGSLMRQRAVGPKAGQ